MFLDVRLQAVYMQIKRLRDRLSVEEDSPVDGGISVGGIKVAVGEITVVHGQFGPITYGYSFVRDGNPVAPKIVAVIATLDTVMHDRQHRLPKWSLLGQSRCGRQWV